MRCIHSKAYWSIAFMVLFSVNAHADDAVTSTPSPYQLRTMYQGEEWAESSGGGRHGNVYMQNFDLKLRVDTEQAYGWDGGLAVFEGYYASSRSTTKQYTNMLDSASPIDTYGYERYALYQAYYDQEIGRNDFILGFWDPQQDFGNTDQQNLFLNRNFTWNTVLDDSGSSLQYAGNYPWTTLVFRAKHHLDDHWTVQSAIINGMSDINKDPTATDLRINRRYGLISLSEVNYVADRYTKAYIGAWAYTGKQEEYNIYNQDGSQRWVYGSEGGYIGASTRVYTLEGRRGMDVFANLAVADPRVTELDRAVNAGVTYTGLFASRPIDKAGIGLAVNGGSAPYLKSLEAAGSLVHPYESTIEMTYHAKLTDWLVVQPSIQYVINPFYTNERNAVLVGLHFELKQWLGL